MKIILSYMLSVVHDFAPFCRLYNVWRLMTCLLRCLHGWRTQRGMFLFNMDGSVIFRLSSIALDTYALLILITCFVSFYFIFCSIGFERLDAS
jgi:hypothetical protein